MKLYSILLSVLLAPIGTAFCAQIVAKKHGSACAKASADRSRLLHEFTKVSVVLGEAVRRS